MGKVCPEEFRRKAVELYRLDDDVTYAQVARDLCCSSETVRAWAAQADTGTGTSFAARSRARIDEGLVESDEPTSDEKAELEQLRREKLTLEKEVRILKAATAYFASDQL